MDDTIDYSDLLTAAIAYRDSKWGLGDKLVEKCGVPGKPGVRNEAGKRLDEAQKFLADNGFSYGISMLTVLRDVSAKFPASKRLEAVTWSTHKEFIKHPNDLAKLHKKWIKNHPGETFTVAVAKALVKEENAKIIADDIRHTEQRAKKAAAEAAANQPETPQDLPVETPDPQDKEVENEDGARSAILSEGGAEPQANGNGADTPADAPTEAKIVPKETWEAESVVRFSAAVKTMLAELETINNHFKSGTFGNAWHARASNDLDRLKAGISKTYELLDTVDDDKRAGEPVIGADNVVPLQSATTH